MKYKGASGSANEIIMILAFGAGLIVVFYVLAKREAENALGAAGKAVKDAVDGAVAVVTSPVTAYTAQQRIEAIQWKERVALGVVPADIPVVDVPILGEKAVYSIPSGGGEAFGSGTKEDDFIDIGYGVLIPAHAYFYNIRVW